VVAVYLVLAMGFAASGHLGLERLVRALVVCWVQCQALVGLVWVARCYLLVLGTLLGVLEFR
jgi:hypothetical protein